jgi:flagellar assembly factor FliW
MKIDTLRFGAIEAEESRVITMKGCILGFDRLQHYIILIQDKKTPLCWLQSLEDGAVAFVVIDPRMVKPDYRPEIDKVHRAFLGISQEEDMCLLSIVTIRREPFGLTANLRAPLVINMDQRLGSQIVLEDADYPVRYDISSTEMEEMTDTGKVACL